MDAVVIVATLVADIVDLVVVHDRPHSLSKVKGLFRLIRIFLILRKARKVIKKYNDFENRRMKLQKSEKRR